MIQYRLATYEDNQQLIELTSASGMTGKTALRIDRNPNFFALLRMRGESQVFTAINENTIVGSLSVSLQKVFLNGEIIPVQYIGDFKVAESSRGLGIGTGLCNELIKYGLEVDGDLFFLTVAKGNSKPFPFFKGRPHLPDFENIGTFHVHQFLGRERKVNNPAYNIEPIIADDEIVKFLNNQYIQYALGSVVTKEKLAHTSIYVIKHNGNIIASMCLCDTMEVKQNVILQLSTGMKFLFKFLNTFHNLLGISRLPELHEPVRMLYIKYMVVVNNERHLINLLINYARNIVYDKSYSFVSLGLHEKDPMNNRLTGFFRFTFYSVGMLISIKNNQSRIQSVKQGIPFEDYSLV